MTNYHFSGSTSL